MSTPERWIIVTRWDDFQHRDMARSTVPPWIKTYTKLLSDDDFLDLSHHLRGVLLGIWLEYARATRQLRGSNAALTRRLGQRVTARDLEALNHAGFIEFSASKPDSNDAGNVAGVEVEVEREGFNKTPRSKPRTPEQRIAAMIRNGVIADNVDLTAELRANGVNGETEVRLRTLLTETTA